MKKQLSPRNRSTWALLWICLVSGLSRSILAAEPANNRYGELTRTFRQLASADPEAQQVAAFTLIGANAIDVVPLLVGFLRERIEDGEGDVWRRAYIALERHARLHESRPNLDEGLLRMKRDKTEVRDFGGIPFIWIPKGWFVAGTTIESSLVLDGFYPDCFRTEVQRMCLDGFWIAETELTFAQVERYGIREGTFLYRASSENPATVGRLPAVLLMRNGTAQVSVGLKEFLEKFTEAVHKGGNNLTADLPTERQWERAARGDDGRLYPWGNSIASGKKELPELVINRPLHIRQVGAIPLDTSPYGVKDMVGNVSEPVIRNGPPVYYEWQLAGRTVVVRGCGVDADGFAEPLVAYRSKNGPLGIRLVLNPADCKNR